MMSQADESRQENKKEQFGFESSAKIFRYM